jgi:hypothetical protein
VDDDDGGRGSRGCRIAGRNHILSTLLFNVRATDPATFVFVAVILTAVALFASFLPAFRATRVDPVRALREDSLSSYAYLRQTEQEG